MLQFPRLPAELSPSLCRFVPLGSKGKKCHGCSQPHHLNPGPTGCFREEQSSRPPAPMGLRQCGSDAGPLPSIPAPLPSGTPGMPGLQSTAAGPEPCGHGDRAWRELKAPARGIPTSPAQQLPRSRNQRHPEQPWGEMSARAARGAACKEGGAGMATCSHGGACRVLASRLGLHKWELLLQRTLVAKLPKVSPAQQPHVRPPAGRAEALLELQFSAGTFCQFQ